MYWPFMKFSYEAEQNRFLSSMCLREARCAVTEWMYCELQLSGPIGRSIESLSRSLDSSAHFVDSPRLILNYTICPSAVWDH